MLIGTQKVKHFKDKAMPKDIREYFKKKLKFSSVSKIELERSAENFVVSIYTSRPGIIIGTIR